MYPLLFYLLFPSLGSPGMDFHSDPVDVYCLYKVNVQKYLSRYKHQFIVAPAWKPERNPINTVLGERSILIE
jgi:hypothetical protein